MKVAVPAKIVTYEVMTHGQSGIMGRANPIWYSCTLLFDHNASLPIMHNNS